MNTSPIKPSKSILGRATCSDERRRTPRRDAHSADVIASHWAFSRAERGVLRELERRRELRRSGDQTARIKKL